MFIYYGVVSTSISVISALVITIILASLSWSFVEKPGLKLKKHPLNSLNN